MTPTFPWHLEHALTALPDEERAAWAAAEGLRENQVAELAARLKDPARIGERVSHLSADARSALETALLQRGEVEPPLTHGGTPRPSLTCLGELETTRFVFRVQGGVHFYARLQIPDDCHAALVAHLFPAARLNLVAPARSPRASTRVPHWEPDFHDLFQVLAYARDTPIRLTQSQDIYRRVQSKLAKRTWSGKDSPVTHARLQYLVDFAVLHRLLLFDAEQYHLALGEDAAEQFWSRPSERQWEALLYFYSRTRFNVQMPRTLTLMAATLDDDEWLDLNRVAQWLKERHISYPLAHVLQPMVDYGLWETAGRDRGRLTDRAYAALRGRFDTVADKQIIVQPTGDVLVPPESPYRERWQIDGMMIQHRSDRMAVYRIDRPGIARALHLGWDADRYVDQLSQMSRMPLPANLVTNIRDWFRSYTRHRFMRVTVVHSADAADSAQVGQALGPLAVGRLSPNDVIIPEQEVERARKLLERGGVYVLDTVESPGAASAARPAPYPDLPAERVSGQLAPTLKSLPAHEIESALKRAVRDQVPLAIRYRPPDGTQPRDLRIVPYNVAKGWVFGIEIPSQAPLSLLTASIEAIGDAL